MSHPTAAFLSVVVVVIGLLVALRLVIDAGAFPNSGSVVAPQGEGAMSPFAVVPADVARKV